MARHRAEEIGSNVVHLLKEKREELGLSMYEVAKRSGLSHTMISRVEKELRKPTLDTILRMCGAMGVEFSPILKESEKGYPITPPGKK